MSRCHAFLAASLEPDVQQIMLIDGLAVLGWEVWRQMDAQYAMRLLRTGINELATSGQLHTLPTEVLTHMLSGAMNEVALWIVRSAQPQQTLAEAIQTLDHVLAGLHREPGS